MLSLGFHRVFSKLDLGFSGFSSSFPKLFIHGPRLAFHPRR